VFDHPDPMRRGAAVLGGVLIVVGAIALAGRAVSVDLFAVGWPLFVIVPGVLMFAAGVGIGGRAGVALAIPGGIVTMVGLVLAVQAATGLWATWAYAWALVAPGGVGLALVLYGLITRQPDLMRVGWPVLATGIGLFLVFGLFFEAVIGLSGSAVTGLEPVLAAGLIVVGVVMLLAGSLGRRPMS
jgi:hypothetical protein